MAFFDMLKRLRSEHSPASNGILTTLFLCQMFTPWLRRGFILAVLGAAGLFAGVTYSKGIVAWSSVFIANPLNPKALLGEGSSRLVSGNKTFANFHGHSGVSHASQMDSPVMNRTLYNMEMAILATRSAAMHPANQQQLTDSQQGAVSAQTLHDFGRVNDVVAVTEAGTSDVQEVLPEDTVIRPRTDVEGPAETTSVSVASAEDTVQAAEDKSTGDQTLKSSSYLPEEEPLTTAIPLRGPDEVAEAEASPAAYTKPSAPESQTETTMPSSVEPFELARAANDSNAEAIPAEPVNVNDSTSSPPGTATEGGTSGSVPSIQGSSHSIISEIMKETSSPSSQTPESTLPPLSITTQERTTLTATDPSNPRNPKSANSSSVICNTTFCKMEAMQLSGIFQSGRDPCDNFYKFVCTDWQAMSSDSQKYESADDALSGMMEDLAHTMLKGKSPTEEMPLFTLWKACMENGTEDKLKATLASFGISLENQDKATIEDVLKAAGNLLFKLNTAPLLSIELAMVPANETAKMISIGEADTILSSMDAMMAANTHALQELTCRFVKAAGLVVGENSQLCKDLARVAVDLAKASYEWKPVYDRMEKYLMANYSNVSMFQTLFNMIDGVKSYTGHARAVLVKNSDQLEVVKAHFKSPTTLYAYLAFHTTIYLSPFFKNMDYLWDAAMFVITGRNRPQPVPKWRLCLRLVDMVLPGFMIVAFEKNDSATPVFVDLMADVMAEEVRSSFIDEVMAVENFDNWTRYMLTKKAQGIVVHSLFPARYVANVIVKALTLKINTQIHRSENSLEYFLRISAFMAKDWTASLRHPLVDRRRGVSLFDTDCHFNGQKNAVVLPLAFYNISVPTSAKERMFHIPRIGPRITQCLFRATFGTNFFRRHDFLWTGYSSSKVDVVASCFNGQYKNENKEGSKLTRIEANTGIVVALKTFQDRLFSKHYLELDYSLEGLPNASADQLFFVKYALSLCHRPDLDTTKMMMSPEERVNVPLMNSVEFSSAFNCRAGRPMNPTKKCAFWD